MNILIRDEDNHPLHVAIIGAGPAGFYSADQLFKEFGDRVQVDMYDRLPTPFGLVRYGVAPDHLKIKSVTKLYERIANKPGYRFWGNVEFGKHIDLGDLRKHYNCIIFAYGANGSRRLGIPGENLQGSHAATDFVGWYNGHPDYSTCVFDLSVNTVVVVGIGNVAVDVARVLCLTEDELLQSDIADYALDALLKSKVKEVVLLGRRGPAQAAFTNPEAKELGNLQGADIHVIDQEAELDMLSRKDLDLSGDKTTVRKLEIIQNFAERKYNTKAKVIRMRFLISPIEMYNNGADKVSGMRLVKNEIYRGEQGSLKARPTDVHEDIETGLVFRSVGYLGSAVPGIPFDSQAGIICHSQGRILDPKTQEILIGMYTSGWIKRGPTGVIGTNKEDSIESINCLIEDVKSGKMLSPTNKGLSNVEELVRSRQPDLFTFDDWKRIDDMEIANGDSVGRPRVKLTSTASMLKVLGRS
ncbi:MAG: NADP oxidoreductase [Anaerolineaceae bacterium]|nr:NADP oxidoreductase [Anaerolineaceae bacterium]|tara:strand:+ start:15164 stop:16573 length:1410 start_codon:yes stop_codon:yes gene_type:complete